jgi:leucyl aminopeptidase
MSKKAKNAASASALKSTKKNVSAKTVFGLSLLGWTETADVTETVSAVDGSAESSKKSLKKTSTKKVKSTNLDKLTGRLVLVGGSRVKPLTPEELGLDEVSVAFWQWERAQQKRGDVALLLTTAGPLWLVQLSPATEGAQQDGLLEFSAYSEARDLAGSAASAAIDYKLSRLRVEALNLNSEEQRGVVVGLELGGYRFKATRGGDLSKAGKMLPLLSLHGFAKDNVSDAGKLGVATNLARHLVNLPAGELNPTTYANAMRAIFAGSSTMKVDVWQGKKLEAERCNLLVAVGRAAPEKAALVHLSYRPKGKTRLTKPLAFVGKGVTFDTGGIDIKDADSMRIMKKDMGGSAAVAGIAYYLAKSSGDVACDFYLALAENAVDGEAFRPGDVITARGGQSVEIHNTDAEGRLVLADAIDVAVKQTGANAPLALIDISTLTGAMRVALGTRIAGLFANHDVLSTQILKAGQLAGDLCWRMPLYRDYNSLLKSAFADVANASQSRFGGAITAALFLQRFVGETKWAHLDLYAWSEGSVGAISEPGGSGQGVQVMAQFLRQIREI